MKDEIIELARKDLAGRRYKSIAEIVLKQIELEILPVVIPVGFLYIRRS